MLSANNTWALVPQLPDMNVVSSKWIFKIKSHSNGSIECHKARLVVTKIAGCDYDENFSLVVELATICLILSMALSQGWILEQLDVNNAFLHSELQECVYLF